MFGLAFAAELGAVVTYTNDCDTAKQVYGNINLALGILNFGTGASWTVVWGPAIFSFPINYNGQYVDNVIYVVRDGTSNDYAIAIAGTNALSAADWIFEDLLVVTTVPWFLDTKDTTKPNISLATFNGLSIILNISPPCADIPGTGQNLMSFLGTITRDGPINLITTGHSLGGALSPALALALADLAGQWDPKGNATLQPYAFAGPTPGDADFAQHFKNKIPAGLRRIWNKLDVVPHAWDTAHMQQLPKLYGQEVSDVTKAVKAVLDVVGGIGYTPVNDEDATFAGKQQNSSITTLDAYNTEAGYQHVDAYQVWAGIKK
jgi:hypothetical protein